MSHKYNDFKEDVETFIKLGGTGNLNQYKLDASLSTQKRLLGNRELWKSISSTLSEVELCCLIKGLLCYDKYLDKNSYGLGGSVSPAIILCEKYALRFPEKAEGMIAWVMENRTNPYLPYGSYMPINNEKV